MDAKAGKEAYESVCKTDSQERVGRNAKIKCSNLKGKMVAT